jgi:carboxypeptidase C (cathepsin A)
VQDALGVDLNFTFASEVTAVRFEQSGDFVDDRAQSDIEQLIDMGVYIVVPVGDADYICNYKGNLALFNTLQYSKGQEFANTDFASIMVNDKEVGLVRQIDNFAFAIIYDASHLVPGDQRKS